MMIDANTPPGTQAETDFGYPRSSGAKLMMAFSVIATLAGGVCLTAGGLVLLLADWEGPWTLVSMNSVALLVGLGMVEVAIRAGQPFKPLLHQPTDSYSRRRQARRTRPADVHVVADRAL